jgi:sugar/nucleoside kinase (ribokinase family)
MALANPSPRDLFVGEFNRVFSLFLEDEWVSESIGGSALYAAVGYLIWEREFRPGILTRVGEDFPHQWLDEFSARGVNLEGVTVLPQALDLRRCFLLQDGQSSKVNDPPGAFSRAGLAVPPGLHGFSGHFSFPANRREVRPTSVRESDIPAGYQTATGAHLCPLDYLSHNLLPAVLRRRGFSTITLNPDSSYMDPAFRSDIPGLVTGLTAFLPSEEQLKNLYKGRIVDLWDMAFEVARYGCELIVIKRGSEGQYLYVKATGKKWQIPAYPARVKNSLGAGDAFCGGFLAGYRRTFDPLLAAMWGSVSASLVIEGSNPYFALEALPGLAQARLDYLRGNIKEV